MPSGFGPRRARRRKSRRLLDKPSGARCGAVTVIRPDGSTDTIPALSAAELRRISPERLIITPVMRQRILRRDRSQCRYCTTTVGPFEIDHVIPVIHGGATELWNLVTACADCNRRKGAQGWRPKPLSRM